MNYDNEIKLCKIKVTHSWPIGDTTLNPGDTLTAVYLNESSCLVIKNEVYFWLPLSSYELLNHIEPLKQETTKEITTKDLGFSYSMTDKPKSMTINF